MIFLIDRNLEGYATQLLGTLVSQGWLELFSIRFVMFDEAELAVDSSDREYREQCAVRLVDILLDLENYRGVGRIFIP
ncbi:MAG: hypothetical protein Fur006_06140 [Coleofasciculaceae cyanobacterium]